MNWNDIPSPASDARVVYVSTDGADTNDGYSPEESLRTITAALTRMRHGFPDRLLLRRGDVFSLTDLPTTGIRWKCSGRSASEPSMLGSYGNLALPRPKVVTDGRPGFEVRGGGGTPALIEHVVVMGVEFDAGSRVGDTHGIRLQLNMRDVLIEDVRVHGFFNGLTAQMTGGVIEGLTVRGCVFDHCFSTGTAHAQGIYCDEVTGLLIEGCVVDDVGENHPDIFMHGLYIQGDARNVTVRECMILRVSSHGAQLRSGGLFERNVVVGCPIGLLLAGNGEAMKNVITEATDISPTVPRRMAIDVQNVTLGARIAGNVIAHTQASSSSRGVQIQPLEYPAGTWLGSHNVVVEGNTMHEWAGPSYRVIEPPGAAPGSTIHSGLVEHDNHWGATAGELVDPITIEAYAQKVGLDGSIAGLAAACVQQSRHAWRSDLSAEQIATAFRRGYARV